MMGQTIAAFLIGAACVMLAVAVLILTRRR